jgi:hypothetical protein
MIIDQNNKKNVRPLPSYSDTGIQAIKGPHWTKHQLIISACMKTSLKEKKSRNKSRSNERLNKEHRVHYFILLMNYSFVKKFNFQCYKIITPHKLMTSFVLNGIVI